MRLFAPIVEDLPALPDWIQAHHDRGYRALVNRLSPEASREEIEATRQAAAQEDLVIAEVGCWSNPLSPDESTRSQAVAHCKKSLELAERLGACCCVNIAGSRSATRWAGPDPQDLSEETFELLVQTLQEILDAVKPTVTTFCLETMPWMHPASVADAKRLVAAVDRPAFGLHFDFINMINSYPLAYNPLPLIEEGVRELAPWIQSVHFKDFQFGDGFPIHIQECAPGKGELNLAAALKALAPLGAEMPLGLEHLSTEAEYFSAAEALRKANASLSQPVF